MTEQPIEYRTLVNELKLHAFSGFGSNEVTPAMAMSYLTTLESVQAFLNTKGIKNPRAFLTGQNRKSQNDADLIADRDCVDDIIDPDNAVFNGWNTCTMQQEHSNLDNTKPIIVESNLNEMLVNFFTEQEMKGKSVTPVLLFNGLLDEFLSKNVHNAIFKKKSGGRGIASETPARERPKDKKKKSRDGDDDENIRKDEADGPR